MNDCRLGEPQAAMTWPVRIEFHLKGPAYYDRALTLRGGWRRDRYRFDLYCGSAGRPCITGQMGPVAAADLTPKGPAGSNPRCCRGWGERSAARRRTNDGSP